ncbi:putative NBD/HSP70 family sugar kinase [Bacillus tianshenii]|uniref:NBD/HSP70 family sugar kinase n=1 Tax=Sutcliffiella tianshenii TaxID=1463404 RepID=A0ABS2P3M1_9BACI|nr:ROK family transcriptional regulator [Bacillus tianshenii]MBM7621566.1 putative NBD/HSP70 family sugar kinase [Bacillus tianshenii]
MHTGDASYIRQLNRKIILQQIMQHKSISRAEIAKSTGLNKATVSSQIADMLGEGLLLEQHAEVSSGGRKPIYLSFNGSCGYAIGVDIDVNSISIAATDIKGKIVAKEIHSIEDSGFLAVEEKLKTIINKMRGTLPESKYGMIGIGIGVHGIVDNDQTIIFTPQHQWRNIDLKRSMESFFQVPVIIANNSNLCAVAEQVFSSESTNLACITTYSGIGMGIIIQGMLFQGFEGFSGEVGHMIIEPEGRTCTCGNKGCFEQYASEKVLLQEIRERIGRLDLPLEELHQIIEKGGAEVEEVIKNYTTHLAIGVNNIINILNPEKVIINCEIFSYHPAILEKVEKNLTSIMNHRKELKISTLGKNACMLGASASVIKDFLKTDHIVFSQV